MEDQGHRVAASELRQFIERYEKLDEDRVQIAGDQKNVLAEAKFRGYDVKIMRKLIAMRKKSPNEIQEEEALLTMYREALGM